MKNVIVLMIFSMSNLALAEQRRYCDASGTNRDCEVVKVLTRCDMAKYKLNQRIEKLQKELETKKEKIIVVDKPVYVKSVFEKHVTKTRIKHHIVSIFGHPAATSSQSSSSHSVHSATANGRVDTEYVPGLMYQYQFNFGLVPMVGVDTEKQLIFGAGFEF